ncbi:Ubiquitin carboxyl-terminal hydrolase 13 [Ophiophagus hannah]|uniref:Ubiquitin carboxyl-terminal hydrolase n=1 Tax=Ophiophagus hannah TaxID=8665 RepID=V8NNK4_OPHHA|nr:Ubiquitin carboxyl-terminal hydrolase 13 [Ophiophagus hannah]
MNTFLGFGREHVERHYRKTGQCVYLHIKRHMREKVTGASGGALPKRRNIKLFLGISNSCSAERKKRDLILSGCGEKKPFQVKGASIEGWGNRLTTDLYSDIHFSNYENKIIGSFNPGVDTLTGRNSPRLKLNVAGLLPDPNNGFGRLPEAEVAAAVFSQLATNVCHRPNANRNLESNSDLNNDDYEYEDEAKLVIFPDHYEIPLPNIEELPALCSKCDLRENLWLNLTDGSILCGKWFFDGSGGNGHALEHFKEMGYPLAVKLGTITPDGADVYSFEEEEAVLDPHIAKHLAHFGIDMLQMHVTENGLRDNEIKPRVSEWEVIQESGMKLKPMYGPGYTGMKNMGNSCYISSVLQAIFSIPEFQRAYVGNLPRIFDYSSLDPTQDFNTQMAKLGHGLLSGQYSKPPVKSELIEQVMKEQHKPQCNGISPRMFKAFVSKGHPEFSSSRQQDALEFFLHLINLIERNRIGSENPSDVFRFLVEERTQCCQTRKVRYTERVEYLMQLPVAMEAAINKDELIAYELKRREAETARRPPPEMVRARIPFSACLQAFTEPENVEDFWSNVSIDMPDLLDITHLRATGFQPGEEELPDISPPVIIPDDPKDGMMNHFMEPPDFDESSVMQLAEMGFPLEACRKAVYYTGNMGGSGVPGLDNQPPEEMVSIISSMGFQRNVALQALRATNNNLEHALDWIFSHPEPEEETEVASEVMNIENHVNANILAESDPEGPRIKDGPGRYELFGFISHMGTSTMSGHYVCHLKKEGRWVIYNDHKVCASEQPPIELGYIYFYHRIPRSHKPFLFCQKMLFRVSKAFGLPKRKKRKEKSQKENIWSSLLLKSG